MTRCVVNVATGRYVRGQERLRLALKQYSPEAAWIQWTNVMPPGSPEHDSKPYAFKAWALKWAADEGYDTLLWADAAVLPLRSLEPLWYRIERDGYWVALNGWTNYEWTADEAYADLFPGVPIDEAREVSKTFPQILATSFGISLKHTIGRYFLDEYLRLAKTNAFRGPWANAANPNCFKYSPDSCYTTKVCGPPDVIGHRHDQTAASVIAWRLGMKLTQCPEIFSYPPGHEGHDRTILLAAGAP